MNTQKPPNKPIESILFLLVLLAISSCTSEPASPSTADSTPPAKLFRAKSSDHTGIDFINKIVENDTINYFSFMHLYMGAGMASGDINNDGLPDLFFNSSLGQNKLYLNQGGLKFEDISQKAGVADTSGFATGVSMADVNEDGLLDIYVCKSGWFANPALKKNQLYINQGNATFKEQAEQYGIADAANSTQASFFDYDKDGDLDMFLINTPVQFSLTRKLFPLDDIHKSKDLRQFNGFDKLYRNEGGERFVDVTSQAGIHSDLGFGLSVLTTDFNQDGWPDVYIANDFMTPDYLYINQQNGTFKSEASRYFKHTSFYSMGADAADINNDGLTDLYVLDMAPEDHFRSKTTMEMVEPAQFFQSVEWGYNHQYMHNVLHLNNGNASFSEIAQLSGIAKTDWSWTPLLADFDNDGDKDIFVTNGVRRDVTNRDFPEKIKALQQQGKKISVAEAMNLIPSQKISNYAYINNGNYSFEKVSEAWGLNIPSFSNGAVAADLDGDGDLDIVTNNIEDEAFVFENLTNQTGRNYLRIQLIGSSEVNAMNARVKLLDESGKLLQFHELITTRGYFSASENVVHFGLGDTQKVPKVQVLWADGQVSELADVLANQLLKVKYGQAMAASKSAHPGAALFVDQSSELINPPFQHAENAFDDFKDQILLPHSQSRHGPALAVADVNGDGLEDFFVGGAHQQPGTLYVQTADGSFSKSVQQAFGRDQNYEDVSALFFDADQDGDADLYVVSGGAEFGPTSANYQDRLYRNDGRGTFKKGTNWLPEITASGGCVAATDFDGDGDLDLFVGGRVLPNQYPYPPKSYLLENTGTAFKNSTASLAPELEKAGMVTTALFSDFNNDQLPDLLIAGEWMNIEVYVQQAGKFVNASAEYGLDQTTGWWNRLYAVDVNGDGQLDVVAGNLGLNYKFHATPDNPFPVYCNDFDENGSYDVVLAKNKKGIQLPVRGRTCSSLQMSFIQQKFPTFESYAKADLAAIYGEEGLQNALHYEAHLFESVVLVRQAEGFEIIKLPVEAQFSPVNGIVARDFNTDGAIDLVIAGNMYHAEVETTRADAGNGLYLQGTGDGHFKSIGLQTSGIMLPGDVKNLLEIQTSKGPAILVANNDAALQIVGLSRQIQ